MRTMKSTEEDVEGANSLLLHQSPQYTQSSAQHPSEYPPAYMAEIEHMSDNEFYCYVTTFRDEDWIFDVTYSLLIQRPQRRLQRLRHPGIYASPISGFTISKILDRR